MKTIKVPNAEKVCDYFERNRADGEIFLQFIDFDKIEISISDDYDGDIEDAEDTVMNVIFSARLT